ncbi:hypothetical protein VRK_38860 [Vibrio sp. MEBiC08052]|nr:hypothetical protein VRK_38860 [Vibrio sp. MEBiC08052]
MGFDVAFVLSAARFSPLLISGGLPPFSRIPRMVRVILMMLLSVLFSDTPHTYPADGRLVVLIFSELIIGCVFIFGLAIVYGAIDFVGKAVDVHMGFAAVNVFNPFSGQSGSIFGNLLSIGVITLFVSFNLHTEMVRLIGLSIQFIPLGSLDIVIDPGKFIAYLGGTFVMAMMIFIPVFSALFLTDFVIGLVSKSMPQMNVYFVTLPLKIFCGVMLMAFTIKTSMPLLTDLVYKTTSFIEGI